MSDQSVVIGETLSRRAYIGGLSRYITENDLKSRFGSFGVISKIDIIRDSSTGETLTNSLGKKAVYFECIAHTFWFGFYTRGVSLKEEWENQKALSNSSPLIPKKRRRRNTDTIFAEDMSLVTDNNVDGRKGWKKSKYGRAVSVMHIRRNDGTKLTIDPSMYKNNLQKFSDSTIDVKSKSLDQLTYFYNDYINISDDEKKDHSSANESVMASKSNSLLNIFGVKNNQNIPHAKNEQNAEGQTKNIPPPNKLPPSIIDGLKKLELKNKVSSKQEQSNKVRLEAIKQRALEKRAEKDKITQALRKDDGSTKSKNHIIFSDNDLAPEISDKFNLFDSDEEYNNNEKSTLDIAINPIFEGESGRERLYLQRKFRGDDRFKLTSDFVSDDENNDTDENNIVQDSDIDRVLSEEKTKQIGFLKGLLGYDPKKTDPKKKSLQWKEPIHFDPDAPEAKNLELDSDHEDSSESMIESTMPSNPLPRVSKDVKVEINADLKGMFTPSVLKAATPFSLFGGNMENEECEDAQMEDLNSDEKSSSGILKTFSKITDQTTSQGIGSASGPMFFFHFGDAVLSTRSHYKDLKTFMRTTSMEDIVSHWQNTSRDMTIEYKRKHKSASRKLVKLKHKSNQT
ncbi:9777_t:CDS:10 [Dentiscutata erythropus]|uniref:9777_t:CDS:1 n=1 Tax=Dentiscutata erythropus TaxID=1348616 RepID=A0A9N9DRJ5_9GLOM|nr:9777_t:CDS:10 [Dentiscutata erythropus]